MITTHQCKREMHVFDLHILNTVKEPAKTCPVRQYSGDEVGLQYGYLPALQNITYAEALDKPTRFRTTAESPKDPD